MGGGRHCCSGAVLVAGPGGLLRGGVQCIGEYAHDHLLASQQWVADELARAQSNLGVGHYCGGDGRKEVELRSSLDQV
jgi:hypothetical protein